MGIPAHAVPRWGEAIPADLSSQPPFFMMVPDRGHDFPSGKDPVTVERVNAAWGYVVWFSVDDANAS